MGWVLRGDKLTGAVEALLLLASAFVVGDVLLLSGFPASGRFIPGKISKPSEGRTLSMECANWKYEKRLIDVLTMDREQSLRALTKSTDSFLSCHGVV